MFKKIKFFLLGIGDVAAIRNLKIHPIFQLSNDSWVYAVVEFARDTGKKVSAFVCKKRNPFAESIKAIQSTNK